MAGLTVPVPGKVKEQRQEVKLSTALYSACDPRRQQISIKNKNINSKTACHLLSDQCLVQGWRSGTKAHSSVLARFSSPWPGGQPRFWASLIICTSLPSFYGCLGSGVTGADLSLKYLQGHPEDAC